MTSRRGVLSSYEHLLYVQYVYECVQYSTYTVFCTHRNEEMDSLMVNAYKYISIP